MSQSTLTRELALRIGLASKVLPDTSPKLFISVLRACLGQELNERNITELGCAQLEQALNNFGIVADEHSIRQCMQLLLQGVIPEPPHKVTAGSILVAIGSDEPHQVIGHFGACRQFLIYQVAAQEARLIDVRSIDSDAQRQHPDKNTYRAELIADCRVLYIASIGGPAASKIIKYGIHPIKTDQGVAINAIIQQLQAVIAETPPPWLAKSLGIEPKQRICIEQESLS